MPSNTFDTLRFLAEIGLPALATALTSIGAIWSLSVMIPVVSTIVVINTLIGALVGVKRANYNSTVSQ